MRITSCAELRLVLVCLAVGFAAASVFAQPAAIDPQTLIGEWIGEWTPPSGRGGKYYLTIEKIEGEKVQLRIERPDLPDPSLPKDVRFVGTLTGNRLEYAPPRVPRTELTIDGNRMYGTAHGRGTLKIALQKKK
jgi:hypothetical protein